MFLIRQFLGVLLNHSQDSLATAKLDVLQWLSFHIVLINAVEDASHLAIKSGNNEQQSGKLDGLELISLEHERVEAAELSQQSQENLEDADECREQDVAASELVGVAHQESKHCLGSSDVGVRSQVENEQSCESDDVEHKASKVDNLTVGQSLEVVVDGQQMDSNREAKLQLQGLHGHWVVFVVHLPEDEVVDGTSAQRYRLDESVGVVLSSLLRFVEHLRFLVSLLHFMFLDHSRVLACFDSFHSHF